MRQGRLSAGSIFFLCLALGSLTLFGGVLAWASWMEWREDTSGNPPKPPKAAR
jgi:hypothetical protein